MENRIRRESSWNRNEKKVGQSQRSRLISTATNVGRISRDLPAIQSAPSPTEQTHVTLEANFERERTLSIASITRLARMLQ